MTINNLEFKFRQEWRLSGKHFLISVVHNQISPSDMLNDGGNRWTVYAFIYPNHQRFNLINNSLKIYQQEFESWPLHGGCSFCSAHYDSSGKITSYQVGCDYNHLYDECFTMINLQEDAGDIFDNAKTLYTFLSQDLISQQTNYD